MNCKAVQSRLSSYVDAEVFGDESLAIRDHISGCCECAEEHRSVRQLKSLMRSLNAPEPPSDLGERILANCRAAEVRRSPRLWRIPTWGYVGVATASMVLTLVVLRTLTARGQVTMGQGDAKRNLSFEVQQDRLNWGSDPTNGAPIISTSYTGR